MALASTSAAQLAYLEEVTFGVTPGSGTPKKLRMTGESLAYDIQSESSKEINSSRQVSDLVHVGASAQGGVNMELSYREYDPFLEALLAGAFSTDFGTDGVASMTVSFNHSANTITDDGVDGFADLVAGQWISVIGGANAGIYRIQSRADDVLTLDTDTPLVSTASAQSVSITASRLAMGSVALRTFSIEKYFSDVTQYFMYRGMTPSQLELSFETGSILTGSLTMMGANSARSATTLMPGAPSASFSHGVMNAVTGLTKILLNNAPIAGTYIKSAKVSVDAKLRTQTAIGTLGSVGVGRGTFAIGGTLEMYLNDGSIYDTALANTSVSLQFATKDVNNNGYAFIFNNCKLGVPTVQAGGMDADVMLSVPFTAIAPNPSSDKMLIIDRYGVAAA